MPTKADLFVVRYGDKHAAAMIYREILNQADELGITAVGFEKSKSKSKRARTYYKLYLAVNKPLSSNLPSLLRGLQQALKEHPLYQYLSFEYYVVPLTQTDWNFDSYDDPDYQKIFKRKRQEIICADMNV